MKRLRIAPLLALALWAACTDDPTGPQLAASVEVLSRSELFDEETISRGRHAEADGLRPGRSRTGAAGRPVRWSSDAPQVATVDATGLVTGGGPRAGAHRRLLRHRQLHGSHQRGGPAERPRPVRARATRAAPGRGGGARHDRLGGGDTLLRGRAERRGVPPGALPLVARRRGRLPRGASSAAAPSRSARSGARAAGRHPPRPTALREPTKPSTSPSASESFPSSPVAGAASGPRRAAAQPLPRLRGADARGPTSAAQRGGRQRGRMLQPRLPHGAGRGHHPAGDRGGRHRQPGRWLLDATSTAAFGDRLRRARVPARTWRPSASHRTSTGTSGWSSSSRGRSTTSPGGLGIVHRRLLLRP